MNRNLVVCCDGTWNTPDQRTNGVPNPTNVLRLYNAVEKSETQLKYYHPGVGTGKGLWAWLTGGITGKGLSRNIMSAYKWLGVNYEEGDKIFLFGFSRGAYTVRSLAGMISRCGLLNLSRVKDDEELWRRTEAVYRKYRCENLNCIGKDLILEKWDKDNRGKVPIFFIGVWDTVGALGIPEGMPLLRRLFCSSQKYSFHNTSLTDNIKNARHAIALDEMRESFIPTLWDIKKMDKSYQNHKQMWFPGVHGDVGGGYPETGLSDGALKWMIDEAERKKLRTNPEICKQIQPDYQGVLHDSYSGLFKRFKAKIEPRRIPMLDESNKGEIHESIFKRQKRPPITQYPEYHPKVDLVNGDYKEFIIYAKEYWNETGVYLEKGEKYVFKADGEWIDWYISYGPEGMPDSFTIRKVAYCVGTLFGKIEKWFAKYMNSDRADFMLTRRVEELPWMALVGVIANGEEPTTTGTFRQHEIVPIKNGCSYTPKKSGYLYCFANNSWRFQSDNRGSVTLRIRKI